MSSSEHPAATGCQCDTCKAHVFNPSRLVAARKRRGMSRWALAVALDLPSVVPLGRIESGTKHPDEALIQSMAHVLGFPVGFFYAHDLPTLTLDMIS